MIRLISASVLLLAGVVALISSTGASGQPDDLASWQAESYPAVAGFPDGNWQVAPDGLSVSQVANGQPTMFTGPFEAVGASVVGTVIVTGEDDDFFGFVIGFSPGDSADPAADFLIVDWKRGFQTFDFPDPSCTPEATAPAGLALSRVTGVPTADEFWGHTDFDAVCSGPGTGLQELARGSTLGATGWQLDQTYSFRVEVDTDAVRVFIDGSLEIDHPVDVPSGMFGFYTFSQAVVTFADLTITLPPPPTPEPTPTPDPCPADVNGDGVVDGRDVSTVATAMPSTPDDRRWNPVADLNADGMVTVADLHIVEDSKDDPACAEQG